MKAALILENGMKFIGRIFGHYEEIVGEVVFNTGMTGYQEVLTDPSYCGQIVTMTYPLIGNYGINLDDMESTKPQVRGFIVRENAKAPSNWRCEINLDGYLKANKIVALEGIDTRALTKIIRNAGTMRGIITTNIDMSTEELMTKVEGFNNKEAVMNVTTKEVLEIAGDGPHVAIMDFGMKQNIVRSFMKRGCRVTVLPADTSAEEVLSLNPDGVFLSNGPGDPKDLPEIIENIKKIIKVKPTVGICLGHQLIVLSLGGDTEKLKYGHRGCNHPVKDVQNDRVYITSQNHGYVVKADTLPEDVEITHINLNDGTVEGMKHKTLPIYSVQFHPEASPGPQDTAYVFEKFMEILSR